MYGFYAGGNRTVEDVTLEGNILCASGAMDNGWYRMRFAADRRTTVDVCRMASYDENGVDYGTIKYFIGGEEVSEKRLSGYTDQIEARLAHVAGFSRKRGGRGGQIRIKCSKAMRTRCSALFGAIFRHGTKRMFSPLLLAQGNASRYNRRNEPDEGERRRRTVMSDQVKQIAMRILDLREISDYTVERMAAALDVPVGNTGRSKPGKRTSPSAFW